MTVGDGLEIEQSWNRGGEWRCSREDAEQNGLCWRSISDPVSNTALDCKLLEDLIIDPTHLIIPWKQDCLLQKIFVLQCLSSMNVGING